MPTPVTASELLAELVSLTDLSEPEWRDFLSLSPEAQGLAAEAYRSADWVQTPDNLDRVLVVLEALGTIAGHVSGTAGAISAIRAL